MLLPQGNPNISLPVLLRTSLTDDVVRIPQNIPENASTPVSHPRTSSVASPSDIHNVSSDGQSSPSSSAPSSPLKSPSGAPSPLSWMKPNPLMDGEVFAFSAWKDIKEYLEVEEMIGEFESYKF